MATAATTVSMPLDQCKHMPEEALDSQSECILVSAMVHLPHAGMKPSFNKFWRIVLYICQNLNKVCMPSVTYNTSL